MHTPLLFDIECKYLKVLPSRSARRFPKIVTRAGSLFSDVRSIAHTQTIDRK